MRILYFTAGAAGMYCGSCLRDNVLATELRARGHDVVLLPLYTPTRTDEPNVSEPRVFFGGISVYLQQHLALFRKTPWSLDRLWDAPAVIRAVASRSISTNPRDLGELTVSMLKGEEGFQSKEIEKLLHWLRHEPAPDVIDLQNSLLSGLARPLKRALGRPVCCTLQGEDLFLDGLEEPYRTAAMDLIRRNASEVDGFLAVSEYYREFMADYLRLPPTKIHIVSLGINLTGYSATARQRSGRFTVGYFARVAPEKGLHVLCDAYRRLRGRLAGLEARLEVAGYLAPEHKAYLRSIERQMRDWGLGDEFAYRGVLDRDQKIAFLRGLDILSVPATYAEPKGMFLLEAMANGTPVVQPRRGAFPEIIAKTGGGILVDPDDVDALAEGIASLWRDPARAAEIGQRGAQGVREHFSAGRMADRALEAYRAAVEACQRPSPARRSSVAT